MQTYGSIIPGGPTLARLLPEGAQEGREEPRLSREAKARLRAVEWHKDHGEKVSLTARRFGRSRSTLYQWLECYRLQGPRGLQDRSHRPHQVRKPTWSLEFEAAVLRLRQDNPVWGKDKLQPILRRQGVHYLGLDGGPHPQPAQTPRQTGACESEGPLHRLSASGAALCRA